MGWRRAIPGDDDRIVALTHRLYIEDPSPAPVPEAHTRATLAKLREEPARGMAVVLDVDGAVHGYALLISFWSNELGGEVCTIDEIYVDVHARSRGHTTSLVTSIRSGAAPWGRAPVALELEVSPSNKRARALYERLGFRARRNDTLRLRP
jgi:ribosomal protein S18 acetylase RimI-like enzyme